MSVCDYPGAYQWHSYLGDQSVRLPRHTRPAPGGADLASTGSQWEPDSP